jgi:heme-degrading monooxygenase HmoA
MSVLSTAIYTVGSEEAKRFAGMAEGMEAAYQRQPGFQRLIVARLWGRR